MSRTFSRLELALGVGFLALAGFVGAVVLSAKSGATRAVGLAPADSLRIAAQYQNHLAFRDPAYRSPKWLAHVQIARLQDAQSHRKPGEADRVPQDSITAVLGSSAGSYLESMLAADDGVVSRWRNGERPIRVWVQRNSSEPGFSRTLIEPAELGFLKWNELDLGVQFEIVQDSTLADVHVTWQAAMARPETVGATFRITRDDGWIVLAHVILSTARDIYTVQNAARHEGGHVLGLGHSPNVDDIMAAATEGRSYKITEADARTAALLYRLPAGPLHK